MESSKCKWDYEQMFQIRQTFGPDQENIVEKEEDLNILLFNRQEKVGKFIDFNLGQQQQTYNQQQQIQQKEQQNYQIQQQQNNEEFVTVESKAEQKLKSQLKNQNKIRVQQTKQQQIGATSYIASKGKKQNFSNYQRVIQIRTKFKESGFVKADWEQIIEIQKQQIDKLPIEDSPQREELFRLGSMRLFNNKLLNKMNKESELKVDVETRVQQSTSDDLVMNELIAREIEKNDNKKKIFITEEILLNIMTIKYQVVPWDIKVLKEDNLLIFDKYEKKDENNNYVPSYIDLLVTNENTSSNMPEEEKEFIDLCKETILIHNSFQKRAYLENAKIVARLEDQQQDYRQMLADLGVEQQEGGGNPDNEGEGETQNQRGNFKYVKYELEDDVEVFVRVNMEGYVLDKHGQVEEVLCKVLNEQPDAANNMLMRQKLQTNKGELITLETKNNLCKMCKWLCQAHLTDIQQINLAYVTRQSIHDLKKHLLLQVDNITVQELTNILSFKPAESWAIFKYFLNLILAQPNSFYSLIKAPYKPNVKLYHIPDEL